MIQVKSLFLSTVLLMCFVCLTAKPLIGQKVTMSRDESNGKQVTSLVSRALKKEKGKKPKKSKKPKEPKKAKKTKKPKEPKEPKKTKKTKKPKETTKAPKNNGNGNKPSNNKPNKPSNNKPSNNKPNKPSNNKPNKPSNNKPNKPSINKPKKPSNNKPNKPSIKQNTSQPSAATNSESPTPPPSPSALASSAPSLSPKTCSVDEDCGDEEYYCVLNSTCCKFDTICNVGPATSGGSSITLFSGLSTLAIGMIIAIGLHF
jgi:hypothetical protein